MQAEFRVGPQVNADGALVTGRSTRTGEQAVSDAHARYMEAVLRGAVYLAANVSGTALTNLSTTNTGLILTNPLGSGKNLVLIEVGLLQTSTAAASANAGIQLAANINPAAAAVAHTTPVTPRNALLGGSAGVGLVDSAATLPAAPVAVMNLWQPSVSATATTGIPPVVNFPIDGKIVLAPGTTISLAALAAVSVAAHYVWEEISV